MSYNRGITLEKVKMKNVIENVAIAVNVVANAATLLGISVHFRR